MKSEELPKERTNDDKAISDKDAEAIVLAIKAGSVESGIKAIQTIVDVSQEKIIAHIRHLKYGSK